jgi:hypothetical protein
MICDRLCDTASGLVLRNRYLSRGAHRIENTCEDGLPGASVTHQFMQVSKNQESATNPTAMDERQPKNLITVEGSSLESQMITFEPTFPKTQQQPLPTMYDLHSDNPENPGLPDEFHDWQPQLLSETFVPATFPPEQVFTAKDLNLYYD